MDEIVIYPEFVVGLRRYDDPATFRFHIFHPADINGPLPGILQEPFGQDGPIYFEVERSQVTEQDARIIAECMLSDGYQEYAFLDLPEQFAHFVTHNIAPIEWHQDLDARDPKVAERVVIWTTHSIPALAAAQ
jgi:hypothetical protein